LSSDRVCKSASTHLLERSFACNILLNSLPILAALSLLGSQASQSQNTETPPKDRNQVKQPVEREIVWEGLASYGNYKIFLPLVLFNQLADTNYFGNPLTPPSPNRRLLYGMEFTPIGLRMMWRDNKAIKPYLLFKGGMLVLDHKAISDHGTYENFSMQNGLGVQIRLKKRVDLRLGLWSDFHFSDGFIVPINPGTDMMNANWGISYHLKAQEAGQHHRFPRF
jgi:hypothetical protein